MRLLLIISLRLIESWATGGERFIGGRKRLVSQDGDAYLEVGYCLHYGVGVRKNVRAAITSYRKVLAAYYITEYAREEAQYHLAITLLDSGIHRSSQKVRKLPSKQRTIEIF